METLSNARNQTITKEEIISFCDSFVFEEFVREKQSPVLDAIIQICRESNLKEVGTFFDYCYDIISEEEANPNRRLAVTSLASVAAKKIKEDESIKKTTKVEIEKLYKVFCEKCDGFDQAKGIAATEYKKSSLHEEFADITSMFLSRPGNPNPLNRKFFLPEITKATRLDEFHNPSYDDSAELNLENEDTNWLYSNLASSLISQILKITFGEYSEVTKEDKQKFYLAARFLARYLKKQERYEAVMEEFNNTRSEEIFIKFVREMLHEINITQHNTKMEDSIKLLSIFRDQFIQEDANIKNIKQDLENFLEEFFESRDQKSRERIVAYLQGMIDPTKSLSVRREEEFNNFIKIINHKLIMTDPTDEDRIAIINKLRNIISNILIEPQFPYFQLLFENQEKSIDEQRKFFQEHILLQQEPKMVAEQLTKASNFLPILELLQKYAYSARNFTAAASAASAQVDMKRVRYVLSILQNAKKNASTRSRATEYYDSIVKYFLEINNKDPKSFDLKAFKSLVEAHSKTATMQMMNVPEKYQKVLLSASKIQDKRFHNEELKLERSFFESCREGDASKGFINFLLRNSFENLKDAKIFSLLGQKDTRETLLENVVKKITKKVAEILEFKKELSDKDPLILFLARIFYKHLSFKKAMPDPKIIEKSGELYFVLKTLQEIIKKNNEEDFVKEVNEIISLGIKKDYENKMQKLTGPKTSSAASSADNVALPAGAALSPEQEAKTSWLQDPKRLMSQSDYRFTRRMLAKSVVFDATFDPESGKRRDRRFAAIVTRKMIEDFCETFVLTHSDENKQKAEEMLQRLNSAKGNFVQNLHSFYNFCCEILSEELGLEEGSKNLNTRLAIEVISKDIYDIIQSDTNFPKKSKIEAAKFYEAFLERVSALDFFENTANSQVELPTESVKPREFKVLGREKSDALEK